MSFVMLGLNALVALPKILGYAEKAYGAVMQAYRAIEVRREDQKTKATDEEVAAAIATAKTSVASLNALWK